MNIGDLVQAGGCFTQFKFLAGKSLPELERLIGYQPGRLATGAFLLEFLALPRVDDFDLAGYSLRATHNFKMPGGLNTEVLKAEATRSWMLAGPDKLVKVRPVTPHDPGIDLDQQYPRGAGIPQWILKPGKLLPARVVAVLAP